MLSFLLAFLILTYFEVVIGELVPKTLAIQIAEPMALFFARPITIFYKMTYPLNWVLSRSSRVITGLFGLKRVSEEDAALSEAELRLALSEGFRSGEITPTEYRYLNNVFDFDDRAAQEIMVPRIHIRSISHQATVAEFMELIEDKVYNFLPVAEHGDRDRIIGMIRVKEALHDLARGHSTGNTTMASYIHPVLPGYRDGSGSGSADSDAKTTHSSSGAGGRIWWNIWTCHTGGHYGGDCWRHSFLYRHRNPRSVNSTHYKNR